MMQILMRSFALLAVLTLVPAAYWLKKSTETAPPVQQLIAESDCQPVDRWCHAGKDRYALALRISGPVTPLTAFPVELEIEGLDPAGIEAVTVSFEMQGMDMGLNRFQLEPISGSASEVRYRGMAMLPVCVSGRADWWARINVVTSTGLYQAGFGFATSQGAL